MPKTSINAIRGIRPLPKKITFSAEKDEKETSIELYIYPFTTGEKLELKQLGEKSKTFDMEKEEDVKQMLEQTHQAVYMVLRKSVSDITIEDVKTFPSTWYDKIIKTALKFEGVGDADFDELKKKTIAASMA